MALRRADLASRLDTFPTGLMEPILIVVMGGVVLLIVLAIMLPIIEMHESAGALMFLGLHYA